MTTIASQILVLTILLILITTGCDNNSFDDRSFNQKLWLANPVENGSSSNIRLEMSEDLVKNHLKLGMTRKQTRKLLGSPNFFNSYCSDKNNCDNYVLGEYVLVLTFDNALKLIKKDIVSV